jgi:chromosome segregation ATPase
LISVTANEVIKEDLGHFVLTDDGLLATEPENIKEIANEMTDLRNKVDNKNELIADLRDQIENERAAYENVIKSKDEEIDLMTSQIELKDKQISDLNSIINKKDEQLNITEYLVKLEEQKLNTLKIQQWTERIAVIAIVGYIIFGNQPHF